MSHTPRQSLRPFLHWYSWMLSGLHRLSHVEAFVHHHSGRWLPLPWPSTGYLLLDPDPYTAWHSVTPSHLKLGWPRASDSCLQNARRTPVRSREFFFSQNVTRLYEAFSLSILFQYLSTTHPYTLVPCLLPPPHPNLFSHA